MKAAALAVLCLLVLPAFANAQSTPSSDTVWTQLMKPEMDPTRSAATEELEIVRDRIRIRLISGSMQFARPTNGVRFAAVFHGQGVVEVEPPNPLETQQLMLFLKVPVLKLAFTDATFSFTDGLYEEIEKKVKWRPDPPAPDDLYITRRKKREDAGRDVTPRMLQGILSEDKTHTAFFLAELKTGARGWMDFSDDSMQPEQIEVGRWIELGVYYLHDDWMSFPAGNQAPAEAWRNTPENKDFLVKDYVIQARINPGEELKASAKEVVQPHLTGERVLLFHLDSNLRVESVKDERGDTLTYFQAKERVERSQSYGDYLAVVTAAPLQAGKETTLEFQYGGKRAIRKAGNGNYFCESSGWYPAVSDSFSTKSTFELTFHSPQHTILVATGEMLSDQDDGSGRTTVWKSPVPLAVAGFAYGDYKLYEDKKENIGIEVYANREPDDVMMMVERFYREYPQAGSVGSMSPSAMAKTMGEEMSGTLNLFNRYFSPYPYKTLAVTSLPLSYSYGQGWPGLIYLWSASFLDETQRHQIRLKDGPELTDFFRAHESSHQWWGHKVGWKSYHDQWLSEGFAEFSGNLYVQYRDGMKDSLTRWKAERDKLRRQDQHLHTIDSIGPIWMGARVRSTETDWTTYQDLIYSKGGFVLQMLRMQLWDSKDQDPEHFFKEMMWDYCNTFNNKAASTEDFKGVVEKHMVRGMDVDGNHKMDWFFDEYVYGTGIPEYTFHVTLTPTPDGKTTVAGTLTRSGVPDTWKDVVPLYAHVGGKTMRLGTLAVKSSNEKLNLTLPMKVDKLSLNDFEDMLAEVKQ